MILATTTTHPDYSPPARGDAVAGLGWRHRTFSALDNRDYRVLWWGMVASMMAMQMQGVARGLLAYQLAGTATALGVVSTAFGLPFLVVPLLGGVLADRMRKRSLLIFTQSSLGVIALVNAVLVHIGIIEIWHLFALGIAQGIIFSLNMPARSAIIPEIVGEGQITNAMALNNAGMNFSRIIGPAAAGALVGVPFFGMTGVFYLMASLYVVVLWTLLKIPPGKVPARERVPMMEDLSSGVRYVRRSPVLMTLMAMAFIPIIFGMPVQMLLPVFQKDVFHVDALGLGLLYAALGVGALVGSLIIASLADSGGRGRIQVVTGLLYGATMVAFALSGSFGVALVVIGIQGLASSAYMALNASMIMSYTEEDYYGRVMSIYMMTFGLMLVAVLPMSALVDRMGAPIVVAMAGGAIVAFIAIVSVVFPTHRRLD